MEINYSGPRIYWMVEYGSGHPKLNINTFQEYSECNMAVKECHTTSHESSQFCLFKLDEKKGQVAIETFMISVCNGNKDGIKRITGYLKDEVNNRANGLFADTAFKLLYTHMLDTHRDFHSYVEGSKKKGLLMKYMRLQPADGEPVPTKGVYVLRVDLLPRPFYYVSMAYDIERRIQQHTSGERAYCITGMPFTREEPMTEGMFHKHPLHIPFLTTHPHRKH